jgi:hypothetical protein
MRAHPGGPFSYLQRALSPRKKIYGTLGILDPASRHRTTRSACPRDAPSLLTVVTREQPRIAEICRRCEIGTRLEI